MSRSTSSSTKSAGSDFKNNKGKCLGGRRVEDKTKAKRDIPTRVPITPLVVAAAGVAAVSLYVPNQTESRKLF